MFCNKNGGYIAIVIGVLVAFYVAYKSHAETFESVAMSVQNKDVVVIMELMV